VPLLDRRVEFDSKSRSYPIRQLLPVKPLRSYTWACDTYLDQGQEGTCVGHAWAHEIAARPNVHKADSQLAHDLYRRARQLDQWPGEDYSGTSVLAGAKATQEAGYLTEYRWGFGIDDLLATLAYHGPAVLGINWMTDMWDVDDAGYIHATGTVAGGHAILAHGVNIKSESVLLRNSWGITWGRRGGCRITFADLDQLLHDEGEACVPVVRR
jgi:hypothetical protein